MREIIFRGKRVDNGEWIYGFITIKTRNGDGIGIKYDNPKYFINYETWDEGFYNCEVIPETLGQFTGKLDKNGKKIFEDDIVKYIIGIKGYKSTYNTHTSPVKFKDCKFYPFTSSDIIETEIIGNIHDNPELLSEV